MTNICNFHPIQFTERGINARCKLVQQYLFYALSAAQAGDVVYTTNSSTFTFSGDGSSGNPLTATVNAAGLNIPAPGTPTVQVTLAVQNGTANTYMRSDAAPALSQAIAPTWTALHTFGAGLLSNPPTAIAGSFLNNNIGSGTPALLAQSVESGNGVVTGSTTPISPLIIRCNYGANAIKVGQGVQIQFQTQQASTINEVFRIAAVADSVGGANSHIEFWCQGGTSFQAMNIASSGQFKLNRYLTASTFTGTPVGHIAFDSPGNLLTVPVPSSASPANPTNLIGMTPNNGSLGTFLRSDATHAIDPNIAPTWTGQHVFSKAGGYELKLAGTTSSITGYNDAGTVKSGYLSFDQTEILLGTDFSSPISLKPGLGVTCLTAKPNGSVAIPSLAGSGVRTVTVDNTGQLTLGAAPFGTTINQATSTTLLDTQSGSTITNEGAAGNITLTLPAAVPGLNFGFINVSALASPTSITLTANGTDTIRNVGMAPAGVASVTSSGAMDSC